ncbi:MAG: hypothetical protein KME31_18365 [Tolypothrix carrinoi HA7290-LM1]|nr:hypothetical protein [Tolypothrix carrinoi HA7290-LM1]
MRNPSLESPIRGNKAELCWGIGRASRSQIFIWAYNAQIVTEKCDNIQHLSASSECAMIWALSNRERAN